VQSETNINEFDDRKIDHLKSSISDLRDSLFVKDLKKDLKEFVRNEVDLDFEKDYFLELIEGAPSWLPKANFSRTQTDLIATSPEGEQAVYIDYFTNFDLPSIQTTNGLMFKGSLLSALAGPMAKGQYAQAAGEGALSIGEVSSVTGTVKATRLDGNVFDLNTGDPVFQGDTIETVGSGAVGLVFLDKTTLSLSEGGKMVLDELVYDASAGIGSMKVNMVEGAFSFISGEIAKIGPDAMTLETPVVTCGIRGTTVAGKAAVEGNENAFTLLQDADGGVGQISISNDGGTQVLAQVGATTSISSFTAPPPPPIILTTAQIQANYGTALNVLPPTPVVAPTPQPPPPPQEQQQEQQVQEEATEEESTEEEASEDAAPEEGEGPADGEEVLEGEEGPPEGDGPPEGEEGLEGEEGPPVGPDGEPLAEGDGGPPEGDGPLGVEGDQPPPSGEDGPPNDEQVAAREAFDTALAAGASPEQAMAEAAAASGFDGPELSEQPLDVGPLGEPGVGFGETVTGITGLDPSGRGLPLAPTLIPGTGVPVVGSLPLSGVMNSGQSAIIGAMFTMVPSFGPESMDFFGQEPFGSFDPFLQGPSGFGEPALGTLGVDPYGPMEMGSTESYFFEDPALYDDFNRSEETQTSVSDSSTTTINGTSANDTIDKSSETNSFIINGLDGSDTLKGGINDDQIDGGNGLDVIHGNQGNDLLMGGHGNDTINGNSGDDKISGDEGDDTLSGGDGDDVIFGGIGDDTLTGNDGNDKFYYEPADIDGSSKDIITDFRTNGDDLIVNSQVFTSAYSRKQMHVDSTQIGSNYDITTNSNELPYLFNFTYDVSTSVADNTSGLANHLSGFSISVSGTGASLATNESMYVAIGDGSDTYIYLWTDTNNHHGMIAESELDPVAKLNNFDNDSFSGSEFTFQTISGV